MLLFLSPAVQTRLTSRSYSKDCALTPKRKSLFFFYFSLVLIAIRLLSKTSAGVRQASRRANLMLLSFHPFNAAFLLTVSLVLLAKVDRCRHVHHHP